MTPGWRPGDARVTTGWRPGDMKIMTLVTFSFIVCESITSLSRLLLVNCVLDVSERCAGAVCQPHPLEPWRHVTRCIKHWHKSHNFQFRAVNGFTDVILIAERHFSRWKATKAARQLHPVDPWRHGTVKINHNFKFHIFSMQRYLKAVYGFLQVNISRPNTFQINGNVLKLLVHCIQWSLEGMSRAIWSMGANFNIFTSEATISSQT